MTDFLYRHGDLLQSEAQALVNPVNCVGVMGAGLARQFKERYPEVFRRYRQDCRQGLVRVGAIRLYPISGDQVMAAFPTKEHWKDPSRIEYVRSGLESLRETLADEGIRSAAIPPVGCGLGRLNWLEVEPLILSIMETGDLRLEIYAPEPPEAK